MQSRITRHLPKHLSTHCGTRCNSLASKIVRLLSESPSPATHVRRQGTRAIHFLTQDELRRLFKVIRSKRDKAMFLVAYRHGLRASEIGLLQRADVDAKQGRVNIHRLKGSISGVYPMQPDVLKAVRSYLRTRADESPYLFVSNRNVPIGRFMLWEP